MATEFFRLPFFCFFKGSEEVKNEVNILNTTHVKKIKTAKAVMLCVVFIPFFVVNGIFIATGTFNRNRLSGVVETSAGIVQTKPPEYTVTPHDNNALAAAEETTAHAKEETPTQESEVTAAGEKTQGTVSHFPSTEPPTQTEPLTTAKPAATQPSTTKPVTTRPATTKPVTTQPATTKPATTQPATTKPATTQPPLTTKPAVTSNTLCIHLEADEQTMLTLINRERTNRGLHQLTLDTRLRTAARAKSEEMILLNYFAHQSPVYGSPFDMMAYFGVDYTKAGENIAMNTCVESAHAALMNSDAHRKAILSPDYTNIGIGAYQGVSGKYYTQMFARY